MSPPVGILTLRREKLSSRLHPCSLAKADFDEIMVHFPAERAKMLQHVSEYKTPPRDKSDEKLRVPSVSSQIRDDTSQVEENQMHKDAYTFALRLAHLEQCMQQDGVLLSEMSHLDLQHHMATEGLNEIAAESLAGARIVEAANAAVQRRLASAGGANIYSVAQPPSPTSTRSTSIKVVSSESEQSEHACFANIRKMLTQGADGSLREHLDPLHSTPVASTVAGPSSRPLDPMPLGAHLMHVVEEMDSRTVFLLNLMKVGRGH